MDEILNDFSVRALAAAIEANLFEYFQFLGRSDSVEQFDNANMTVFITGIPHPFMNGAFRLKLTSGEAIEQSLIYFKSRKVPFIWWMGSDAQSVDWGKHLEAHGLVYDEDYSGMAANLQTMNEDLASPSGLTIEPVDDMEKLEHWVNTALIGFGLSDNNKKACFDLFAGLGFDVPLRNYVTRLRPSSISPT